ncbi:unnamed protein product [Larinioides sclopetarius]|uniref:Prokineticin domain-containing protein n=1 Tax=Larinioides sclopetarius TaxID=280406 RepID=A0AAV1ZPQ9_9ARAC
MKWFFGVICLTASLAAVSATFCKSEDDCKEGYCCAALTGSQMLKKGLCRALARERKQCSEPESKNDYFGGKFTLYCPCADGLVCEPNKPGITDPEKRRRALRCQKPSATTSGPDVTTASDIVTDGEVVTNPPDVITDESEAPEEEVVETEAPEEEVVETEAPEEEVVETEAPEEEVVETEAPEEEVVETEAPEEEVVEEETEAPEEEVVEEETEVPEEEVVEEETEAPEEEVVEEETEVPEEEVVEDAGQRGPGGERPREDDPDCEDWTYGC